MSTLALIFLTLIILVIAKYAIDIYNAIIALNNNIDKSNSNIFVLLKQRVEEIPNLIKIVKEHIGYESEILLKLTKIRTGGDIDSVTKNDTLVKSSNQLADVLARINIENYPQLNSSASFTNFQKRYTEIENSIADRREHYNESVNLYNTAIEKFPNNILSIIFNFKRRTFLSFQPNETEFNGIRF